MSTPHSIMHTLGTFRRRSVSSEMYSEAKCASGTVGRLPAQQHHGGSIGETPTHEIFVERKEAASGSAEKNAADGLGPQQTSARTRSRATPGFALPMRTHLSVAAAGVALVLTGCGNDPEGAPGPAQDETRQLRDAGGQAISAHYVDLKGGEWPRGIDVVAAGEKIRVGWRVPEDDPPTLYYWVYDGDRMLEHISDGEIPNTLYESPQQDSEMYPITQGWVLPVGGEALDSACPDGRTFGTKTIAGRTAVGYRCTSKKRRTLFFSKELWIDQASGLVLQLDKELQADEVTENPLIDTGTFSTEPPKQEKVRMVPPK